jgi:amino-acid N-acetyltransferase
METRSVTIQPATAAEFDKVTALLSSVDLPTIDVNTQLANFFIATLDGRIAGSIGLDLYGQYALLRSMAVDKAERNNGIASQLVNTLFDHADKLHINTLFLITNTAEDFFRKKGFIRINREEVPEQVLQSKEFNGLCPSSSVIMSFRL